ncbi:RNA-directed DNA polymerase, eukaryota [Tanacetum coccineum]
MEGLIKEDDEINHEVDEREELCEALKLPVCNIRKFKMIKYSFGQDEEYVTIKEDKYDDLARTSNDACRTYQEIFRMIGPRGRKSTNIGEEFTNLEFMKLKPPLLPDGMTASVPYVSEKGVSPLLDLIIVRCAQRTWEISSIQFLLLASSLALIPSPKLRFALSTNPFACGSGGCPSGPETTAHSIGMILLLLSVSTPPATRNFNISNYLSDTDSDRDVSVDENLNHGNGNNDLNCDNVEELVPDHVSESSFVNGFDATASENQATKNLSNSKDDKKSSEDPFGIYDILNRKTACCDSKSDDPLYPPGFTPDVNHLDSKVDNIDQPSSGSILDVMKSVVEIGQTMGYNMDGCLKNIQSIIGDQGDFQDVTERRALWDYIGHLIDQWDGEYVVLDENLKSKAERSDILKRLAVFDKNFDQGNATEDLVNNRSVLLKDLQDINSRMSLDMAQKAKISWSIEGDENSKYFHGILNKKRSQLSIRGVLMDGNWIDGPANVKAEFFNHFSSRFSKSSDSFIHLSSQMFNCLSQDQVEDLEKNVTYDEVKRADVVKAVEEFFNSGTFPPGCNALFITLIPKMQDAKLVKDFRPISLIGSFYKIVAKILANRLSLVISTLVSDVQSAFISNRQILDGLFILNELISWCKTKKSKIMVFKVDFEKAFDSVKWRCLQNLLGLSRPIRSRVLDAGLFKGVRIDNSLSLSHLFYADDAVFIGIGVPQEEVHSAATFIGCATLSTPFNYLGTKIGGCISRSNSWNDMIVPIGVLNKLESLRRNFFNGVDSNERKFSMCGWKKVLASKNKGGLGISSLFAFNRALLFKWIWRFISQDSSLWTRFIKALYGDHGSIDNPSALSRKSPWSDIIKEVSALALKGINLLSFIKKKVGNGEHTCFWEDVWLDDLPLMTSFPRLYALENVKQISVASKLRDSSLSSSFRRNPRGGIEEEQLLLLVEKISSVLLSNSSDRWRWTLSSSDTFSVKSARNHIDDVLLPSLGSSTRWVNLVPIKINILAWKVCKDILPTRFNLSLRGIDIDSILCPVCHMAGESSSHLFFSCNVAQLLSQKIASWWELEVVDFHSYDDWISWLSSLRLSKGAKTILEGIFYVSWWAIWKYRNQILFGVSPPRLHLIFDEITLMSFTWCSNRRNGSLDWNLWLKCPNSLSL